MVNFTRKSVSFSRRSFVEKFGLGMGAALLAPLAKTLVKEAQGQATDRKIAMFWFAANGINPYWVFTPKEFPEDLTGVNQQEPSEIAGNLVNSASFTLPDCFAPLGASYRNNLLMMEGFKNFPRTGDDVGHGAGFLTLSCVPGANADHYVPGGITFDQHLANTVSASVPRKSALIGISSHIDMEMKSHMFAEGASKPLGAFQNPILFFKDLFGSAMATAGGVGTPSVKNNLLFEGLRHDIERLQKEFAAPEKDKLDRYLATMETYQKRLVAGAGLTCSGGTQPTLDQTGDPVDVLETLNAMASIAVTCGMTNVMGVDVGCRDSHDYGPNLQKILPASVRGKDGTSLGDVGHMDADINGPVITATYAWMSGMVAQTLDALKALPSGNGTLFDNTVAVITSDNGETHHSRQSRWPLLVVGKAGNLKLDGRYIRYPESKSRSLIDVYTAISAGFGVPDGEFGVGADGKGPNHPAQGPLPEMI